MFASSVVTILTASAFFAGPAVAPADALANTAATPANLVTLVATVGIPTAAPVPQVLEAGTAPAKPKDCAKLAKKTLQVSRGRLTSAPEAFRKTKGCGDTIADKVCEASRKKNVKGKIARKAVRAITRGESTTC